MKNKNAQALGSLGGKAKSLKMTAEERKEMASRIAKIRWEKYRALKAIKSE